MHMVSKNIAKPNFKDFIVNHPYNIPRDFMSEMVYFTQFIAVFAAERTFLKKSSQIWTYDWTLLVCFV